MTRSSLNCSKRVIRGETMSLITDKKDSIWKWCDDQNLELPVNLPVWVEEDPDPDRCTFFTLNSFEWSAYHWDRVKRIHCAVSSIFIFTIIW